MADQPKKTEVAKENAQPPDDVKAKTDEAMKRDAKPAWIALLLLMATSGLLLGIFGFNAKSSPVGVVVSLLGATALSVGAFFGFLFGMPRSAADGNESYKPSTNLEQVSDWLTKILIGAGLVQLAALREGLTSVGALVSGTVTPASPGVGVMAQLTLVIFLVIGFLSSFLWTRLYYGRIQTLTDRSLFREVEDLKRETKKTFKALAQGAVSAPSPVAPPSTPGKQSLAPNTQPQTQLPPEIQKKVEAFLKAPQLWESDVNRKLFPDARRETNGRRLDAEIVNDLGGGPLIIALRVVRVGGDPLTAETLFLLHPTIPDRLHRVIPRRDVAETSFYAEGAFTGVAIADDGRTVLAYDLTELPGASKRFREN